MAGEFHLLEQHRHVLVGNVLAHQPVHHPLQLRGVHGRGFGTAAVAVVADHVQRQRSGGGLVLLGHVALDLVEEQARGAQRSVEQAHVAGHVQAGQQQCGDRDILQCGRDLVVGGGERGPGVRLRIR
jgi:hypothetical protein